MKAVREAANSGTAVVIVEQFARLALEVADRAYLLVNGRVDREGTTENLRANVGEIESKYLGVPPTPERYDRLEEALELIKVLWYEEPGVYSGNYYKLDGTLSTPHPPRGRPKILIGGAGPKRTLRLVAEHADEWNATMLPVEGYRSALDMLDRHCTDVGRDPASVRRSMLIFVTSGPTKEISDLCARRFVDLVAPGSGMTIDEMAAHLVGGPAPFTGGAEELIDHLGQLAELGLQEAIFEHFCTERDDFVEWIAADVAPHVAPLGQPHAYTGVASM